MRLRKHKSMVGIDIGTYSMKAVEVEARDDGFYLTKVNSISYPEKILENGEFRNVPLFTDLINELWKESGFNSRNISISWKIENGFFRVLTFPLMPDKELLEAVRIEIGSRYEVEPSLISFDYVILDRDEKGQEIKVLTAGIPKIIASTIYNAIRELGFYLEVIEPEFMCQLSVFYPTEENFILLNIGASSTVLYIGTRDTVSIVRNLRFGGSVVTETISSILNIPFEEAERWKIHQFGQELGPLKTSVNNALVDAFSIFLREINRSIDYFYQITSLYPTRVFLDGGGSFLLGLDNYIGRELSLPVEMLDISKAIKRDIDGDNLNLYSVAIGSALCGLGYKCPYKFFDGLELGRLVV